MKCSSNSGFQLIKPLPTSTVLSFIQIISNDVKRIQFTLNRLIFNQRTNFNFSVERMLACVSLNLQSYIFSLPFPLLSDTRKFLIDIIKQDYNDYRKQSNLSIKNGKKTLNKLPYLSSVQKSSWPLIFENWKKNQRLMFISFRLTMQYIYNIAILFGILCYI